MSKETRDLTTAETIRWILENNPEVDPFDLGSCGHPVCIRSTKPAKDLTLPTGWYYEEGTGITNGYTCIGFELK